MKSLVINYIWCGSDCSNFIDTLLKIKIINLKYFFQGAYKLQFYIWSDRDIRQTVIENLSRDLQISISSRNVFDLFSRLEKDTMILKNGKNPKFLRYLFSDELGTISTYSSDKANIPFRGINKTFENYYKPMPAIAADIVKALLGYYEPGLYFDIGLEVSDEETFDLNHILNLNNTFKDEIRFAATLRNYKNIDFQILYSTNTDFCQKIYKKIIETYFIKGNMDVPDKFKLTHLSNNYRSYYDHDCSRSYSYTCSIWDEALNNFQFRNIMLDKSGYLKKEYIIPISQIKSSIGFVAYKSRNKSLISDYKNLNYQNIRQKIMKNLKNI